MIMSVLDRSDRSTMKSLKVMSAFPLAVAMCALGVVAPVAAVGLPTA